MRSPLCCLCLMVCVLLGTAAPSAEPARVEDKLVEQVRKAIDRGKQFLIGQEKRRGSWEVDVERPGGWTALVLLALLNSGVAPTDDVIKRGLEYLRTVEPSQTYVVGLQTMVFAQAGAAVDRERIRSMRSPQWSAGWKRVRRRNRL